LATLGAHLLGRQNLQGALAGVTFAAPCVLLFWLARRVFYLGLPLIYAAGSSLLYCAVVVAGLLLLNRAHALSPFTAFLLIALAAVPALCLAHAGAAGRGNGGKAGAPHHPAIYRRRLPVLGGAAPVAPAVVSAAVLGKIR